MATFQHRARHHLARYKRERLGVSEDGIWRRTHRSYAHILPKALYRLNILEDIRAEFFRYWDRRRLHVDFHHLNSSQALCFNLFFPFFGLPEANPEPLLHVLEVPASGFLSPDFEATVRDCRKIT